MNDLRFWYNGKSHELDRLVRFFKLQQNKEKRGTKNWKFCLRMRIKMVNRLIRVRKELEKINDLGFPKGLSKRDRDRTICEWKDIGLKVWETQCGDRFKFVSGSPATSLLRFCPYCGRALVEVK